MMVDVLIALAPTLIFAFIVYPLQTGVFLAISLFIMIGCELAYIGLRNMMPKDGLKHSFKEKFSYAYKGKVDINNFAWSCHSGSYNIYIFIFIAFNNKKLLKIQLT